MAFTYATLDDLTAWLGQAHSDADEATRALEDAERDIDREAGGWPVLASGLKFDPVAGDLDDWRYEKLKLATCAQAEYRLHMGREFFVEAQYPSKSGPDFSTTGTLPRLGPQARDLLEAGNLLRLTGVAGRGRSGGGPFAFQYGNWDV